eukprot:COSAG06_NODE_15332_length_1079_cov_8.495918_3_plen_63_part_01
MSPSRQHTIEAGLVRAAAWRWFEDNLATTSLDLRANPNGLSSSFPHRLAATIVAKMLAVNPKS